MESYRIVLRTGGEEEIGPAELVEDDESFVFRSAAGVRSFPKADVDIIEEESETASQEEDGKAA
jgi:hypothetical protein